MSPLPPTLHSLSQLPLPPFFRHCAPPPRANARTSHDAYIEDILIRREDVNYVQNSLNYFDGPARDWGLDMNVSKTEVHANGTAPQKEFLTPRCSEFHTYNKKTGRPHTCYKYLGVYLFTCHQAKGLFHMLKVVSTLQKCQVRRPSPFQDDTWTVAIHSALRLITNPLHIMWIKGHANFIGNEICDHFSKWAAHSLIFTPEHPPPPHWAQWRYTTCLSSTSFKVQQLRHLLPRHSHSNIAVGRSFSLYNKTSWFSSLFFKLASGCYNVHGYQWSNMLRDYHCSRCGQHHPFDPVSCLAFCTALDQHVQAYVSSWGTLFSPIVLHWWLSGPSKADRRNFMRTLVPKSLWSCLSNPIPGSTPAEHRAMLGLALEERVKHLDKAVHQAHDWLCSNPLPWDPILWAHPSDPLNPFSVSHGAFSTSVHMPPRTRPVYQHPPPLPKHALKKPSKPASAKAQPTARRAPESAALGR